MYLLNNDIITEEILKNFPEFKNLHFTFNYNGWTSVIVDIENKYICKFPRDKNKLEFLKKEKKIIDLLKQNITNLIFPKRNFINSEVPFFIHSKIQGEFFTCEKFYKASTIEQSNFINSIASFFNSIHNLNLKDFDIYLHKKIEKIDNLEDLLYLLKKDFSKDIYTNMEKILKKFICFPNENNLVVGYYDMHPYNCLVDSNKNLISVFDFDEMAIGTAKFDLRELILNYNKEIGYKIINAYNVKAKYPINKDIIDTVLVAWSFLEYQNMKKKISTELKEVTNIDLNKFKNEIIIMVDEYAKEYL